MVGSRTTPAVYSVQLISLLCEPLYEVFTFQITIETDGKLRKKYINFIEALQFLMLILHDRSVSHAQN